jgi:hypothetical protein
MTEMPIDCTEDEATLSLAQAVIMPRMRTRSQARPRRVFLHSEW